ncbi:hypothetical protein JVT61DRAFT_9058 [Boletus reticuloceps]|uniref:Uncharacterized protein n=1 Tax=Boletus reticuloceps TaxID=495285 RepID=A0A8I2YGT6_9AGAM|nr:hypothetical protein JVT61DRAFT_12577 [Boletus reticuloceps]KAG6371714.1 hypothetical protein JVT61DRAFT_9058 [Boletus reticuloceps]
MEVEEFSTELRRLLAGHKLRWWLEEPYCWSSGSCSVGILTAFKCARRLHPCNEIVLPFLDTLPYSSRDAGDPYRRKQAVGLYAMNRGDVYAAGVAVYASYAQVL